MFRIAVVAFTGVARDPEEVERLDMIVAGLNTGVSAKLNSSLFPGTRSRGF